MTAELNLAKTPGSASTSACLGMGGTLESMTDRLLPLMDWYNLDLIAFRCTTGTTTGTKSSLDLPTDGSVGKIVFTPVQAPDRAFYRLEWLGYIGGLLTEELAGSLPVVGASPAIPATSSVVAPRGPVWWWATSLHSR